MTWWQTVVRAKEEKEAEPMQSKFERRERKKKIIMYHSWHVTSRITVHLISAVN